MEMKASNASETIRENSTAESRSSALPPFSPGVTIRAPPGWACIQRTAAETLGEWFIAASRAVPAPAVRSLAAGSRVFSLAVPVEVRLLYQAVEGEDCRLIEQGRDDPRQRRRHEREPVGVEVADRV